MASDFKLAGWFLAASFALAIVSALMLSSFGSSSVVLVGGVAGLASGVLVFLGIHRGTRAFVKLAGAVEHIEDRVDGTIAPD